MHTIEARVAYINSQTAMMMVQMKELEVELEGPNYTHDDKLQRWAEFRSSWEGCLGANEVAEFLKE